LLPEEEFSNFFIENQLNETPDYLDIISNKFQTSFDASMIRLHTLKLIPENEFLTFRQNYLRKKYTKTPTKSKILELDESKSKNESKTIISPINKIKSQFDSKYINSLIELYNKDELDDSDIMEALNTTRLQVEKLVQGE
jgi:Zn-dependent peptidase ImmA (M78 family)